MIESNRLFPLADTTPLVRLALWFVLGIVTGVYTSVPMPCFFGLLAAALFVALLLRRPMAQSVALYVCMFLLGATLAVRQRDGVLADYAAATAKRQQPTESPQQFPLRWYQWQQRQQQPDTTTVLGRSRVFFLGCRQRLLDRYREQGLSDQTYAIVVAMTLGSRSAIDPEVRQDYDVSGAAHVLALSGLHMGIIYALLTLLTGRRRHRILSQAVIVLTLWAYVLVVGMPISAVRAASMLTLYSLLSLGYREKMSLNALAFTAIVVLALSPLTLFDIGFQLSYASVLSILVWMPLMERWLPKRLLGGNRLVRLLLSMTAVSIAAQLGSAPLVAYHFGRFSTYFLLTNFVAIPCVTAILYMAIATLLWAPIAAPLTLLVNGLNSSLAAISHLPAASIEDLQPSWLQVLLIYVIILALHWIITISESR